MIVPAGSPEEKAALVSYLAARIGTSTQSLVGNMQFEAAAVTRKGIPVGAVLYTNYRVCTIEMVCAGEPGWVTPGALKAAFAYPFLQLECWTILTHTARINMPSRKFQRRLGFREVGVVACSANKADDAIIYSMTKPECQWINHRQEMRAAA